MSTPTKHPKRRWRKVPLAERRRLMAELNQIRTDRATARKLAEALERVRAAGYEVKQEGAAS
jgi:hypothetical protein